MKYIKKFAITGMILTALIISVPGISFAQDKNPGSGYKVSPVKIQETINKGAKRTFSIYVTNLTDKTTINTTKIVNFTADKDESQNALLVEAENLSKFNIANDFNKIIEPVPDFTLGPNQQKIIPVTLNIPDNANAGGYYGAITFTQKDVATGKNVTVQASVGTLFVITVPGKLTDALSLVEFTAAQNGSNGRFFTNGKNLSVVTRLQNTGNIHEQPFGKIQVTDSKGKVVQEIEFNNTDPRGNVLPNSTRKFTNDLKDQKYFGKYNVTANIGYGPGGGNIIIAKNTFWVIPLWMVIAAGVVLAILAVLIFIIIRKVMSSNKKRRKYS